MKRSTPLKRSAAAIRKRNPERAERQFLRAFGSTRRVEAVRREPCIVPGCWRRSQNCHTETRRTSSWRSIFPCCAVHHHEQHTGGMQTFMRKYRVDPFARAAELATRILP